MYRKFIYMGIIAFAMLPFAGCKKFLEVGPPKTSVNSENVYDNDGNAISAGTGIFAQMSSSSAFNNIAVYMSLSADELRPYIGNTDAIRSATYTNALNQQNNGVFDFWRNIYPYTYYSNAAIEGLTASTSLNLNVKKQLLGEAYFVRAFTYFYLTQIYGDVPLVLTTDYSVSSTMPRTSRLTVYNQIILDLQQAKSLLSSDYLDGTLLKITTERLRPTKAAASALLARVYLYNNDYANAEAEATSVIGNSNYGIVALASTFLKNSKETIWALQPVGISGGTSQNSSEGAIYIPTPATATFGSLYPVYLNDNFISSFESGDNRKTTWVASQISGANTFYYPYKYKVGAINTATVEYSIILRLGEQYLIRAEARAMQNKLSGPSSALSDLNAIRNRSGLGDSPATTQADIITAISKERKVELFTEWGDRWFNMQRTGTIDAIMPAVTTAKGGTWNSYQKLYPIPLAQIQRNPALKQNPGYN